MVQETNYTIQQIADLVGVPKITMYKFISAGPYISTVGKRNAKIYSETVKNRIISDFNRDKSFTSVSETETVNNDQKNNYLSEYIQSLESQITQLTQTVNKKSEELTRSQENLATAQKLIDQAQQLQLDLQAKLTSSEQERLALISSTQNVDSSNEYLEKLKSDISDLKTQLTNEQESKERLQESLASKERYASYLSSEKRALERDNEILLDQQEIDDQTQETIQQLQTKLVTIQSSLEEKEQQKVHLSEQNSNLINQLKEKKQELKKEQNKGFLERLLHR